MNQYCNLNVISEFCLLSSTLKIDEYLEFAEQRKVKVLALSDKNTMYGTIKFYQLCEKKLIKPIIGLTVTVQYQQELFCDLVLYAVNEIGYQNLCQISSIVMSNKNEILTNEQLQKYLNNIIVVIKNNDNIIKIKDYLIKYQEVIDIYLGITTKDLKNYQNLEKLNFKLIAFNEVRYLYPEESKSLQVLTAIKNQTLLETIDENLFINQQYQTNDQIWKQYSVNLIENVNKIVNKINLKLNFNNQQNLLKYPNNENISSFDYLKKICYQSLKLKKLDQSQIYIERTNYELDVIAQTGFADYFLIVWDYVTFAKKNQIMVGPGRGSVAGSLVAFLLDICDIDAVKYSLLFERFLNPERITMPDIDIDFQDDRREEIIQYIVKKYGINHAAHIITFQTITAKIAIKDSARVLNISLDEVDKISKAIPLDLNLNLQLAINKINILQVYEEKYPELFQIAKTIIGLPRQIGTHAAGIILSQKPLQTIVPVQIGYNGIFLTQYSMNYLEDLGLLKMDLLGLRNLTIINQILKMIASDLKIKIDLLKINLEDKKTYQMVANSKTTGIFQLESPGMKKLLTLIKPENLDDIVAVSSLFRPGPSDHIATYIKRKNKQEDVEYIVPELKSILAPTYGIIIYQEQVMLIAQKIANFTLAKADLLRRAIGKKDHQQMKLLEQNFLENGLKNNYSKAIVTKIWKWISHFADYGFNRSHAIAYSLLGYWMAYLKANYFVQFMTCLLTSVINIDDKIAQYIDECRQNNVKILVPSVNYSKNIFTTENNNIRFALTAIKQIGDNFYQQLADERSNKGLFDNYIDFVVRMFQRGLNNRILETLINAGALDEFNFSRKTLLVNSEKVLLYAQLINNGKNQGINTNIISKPALDIYTDNIIEKAEQEKRALGFFLNSHPLVALKAKLKLDQHLVKLQNLEQLIGRTITSLAIINRVKQIKTKKGDYMAFITISDEYGSIDVSIFSNLYQKYQNDIKENNIVLLTAKVDNYQGKIQLILNKMRFVN